MEHYKAKVPVVWAADEVSAARTMVVYKRL